MVLFFLVLRVHLKSRVVNTLSQRTTVDSLKLRNKNLCK